MEHQPTDARFENEGQHPPFPVVVIVNMSYSVDAQLYVRFCTASQLHQDNSSLSMEVMNQWIFSCWSCKK